MSKFAIGDVVRLKGSMIQMCVEEIDRIEGEQYNIRTHWHDHVGQLHRDGFDPRCVEKVEPELDFREWAERNVPIERD
jgi:uncharacterized protein (UPF0335 family)